MGDLFLLFWGLCPTTSTPIMGHNRPKSSRFRHTKQGSPHISDFPKGYSYSVAVWLRHSIDKGNGRLWLNIPLVLPSLTNGLLVFE